MYGIFKTGAMIAAVASLSIGVGVVRAGDDDHSHGHSHSHSHDHADMAKSYTLADLNISGPFTRATLPNAPVAGGYMMIMNSGGNADVLIAARSDIAARTEVHEMTVVDDVMKMRELKDGLLVPAGGSVELKPGGFHIMFMGLKEQLVEGETVEVTLEFKESGTIVVPFSINAAIGKSHKHGEMSN